MQCCETRAGFQASAPSLKSGECQFLGRLRLCLRVGVFARALLGSGFGVYLLRGRLGSGLGVYLLRGRLGSGSSAQLMRPTLALPVSQSRRCSSTSGAMPAGSSDGDGNKLRRSSGLGRAARRVVRS